MRKILIFALGLFGGIAALAQPEIELSGLGQPIPFEATPPVPINGTDFGSVTIGTPLSRTFTIENIGTSGLNLTGAPFVVISSGDAADFNVTIQPGAPFVASGGGTVTFTIEFTPSSPGPKLTTVFIDNSDSDENPFNFDIGGFGDLPLAPEIDITGNSISIPSGSNVPSATNNTDYGNVSVGSPLGRSFTIFNIGTSDLTLTPPVTFIGADAVNFNVTISPNTVINAAGNSNVTIEFNPVSVGYKQVTVQVVSDDPDEGTYTFDIGGTGVAPSAEINVLGNGNPVSDGSTTTSTSNYTDFGSVMAPSFVDNTFIIENTSSTNTLNITAANLLNNAFGDFTITTPPSFTVPPLSSTFLTVRFSPVGYNIRTATVQILNDDSDESDYTFDIAGVGINPNPPEIEVRGNNQIILNGDNTPSTSDDTDFPSTNVGANSVRTFRVNNIGLGTLNSAGVSITGGSGMFTVLTDVDGEIAGGGSAFSVFEIQFTPSTPGTYTATISIDNNDPDEDPFTFDVSGVGGSGPIPEIQVKSGTDPVSDGESASAKTYFGDASIGAAPVNKSFTVENLGTAALNIANITLDEPTFTLLTPTSFTVNPSSTATITIAFSPSYVGIEDAVLSIYSNDGDESIYNFMIAANGVCPTIEFDTEPVDQSACLGASFTISSNASGGTGIAYQWYDLVGNMLTDDAQFSGTATSNLTIASMSPALDGTSYYCVTSNVCSDLDTSDVVMVSLITPISILAQPSNTSVSNGQTAFFQVVCTTPGVIYKWEVDNGTGFVDVNDNVIYQGSNSDQLDITSAQPFMDGYLYRCRLSTACEPSVYSVPANIQVVTNPFMTFGGYTKVYGDEPFIMQANSSSPAPIIYSIDSNSVSGSIDPVTGLFTILGAGVVKVKAWQDVFGGNLKDSAYAYVIINKATPELFVQDFGMLLTDPMVPLEYYTNSDGVVSFGILSGSSVFISSTGQVSPINLGTSLAVVSIAASDNYFAIDGQVYISVVDEVLPPVARDDNFEFTTITNTIEVNITDNDSAVVGALDLFTIDLDTLTAGIQDSVEVDGNGTVWSDTLGNLYFKPFVGIAGKAVFGYTVNDTRGQTSNVAKVTFTYQVPPIVKFEAKPADIFTPNGDGYNDHFVIGFLDNTKASTLIIYDRNGSEIHKLSNYQNDWEGIDWKGRPLDEGIYYFLLQYEDGEDIIGRIHLKRGADK